MLIKDFLKFNKKHNLIKHNSKILLAISGGIDSIVLLDIFEKLNFKFSIAHCNFTLRNLESDADHDFVKKISKQKNKTFYSIKFDTKKYAKENKISLQMAARELRYNWLNEIYKKHNYVNIATAHHLNDNIETIIFNLIKGTGISGIKGILPISKNLVRPLLFATKESIKNYAQNNKLIWREDSSNKKNDYNRNMIRNIIIPQMKKLNPNLENTFKRNIKKFKQAEILISEKVDDIKKKFFKKKNNYNDALDISQIKNKNWAPIIIEKILKPYGFNYIQSEDIILENHIRGTKFLSEENEIIINNNELLIISKYKSQKEIKTICKDQKEINLNHAKLKIYTYLKKNYKIKTDNKIIALDKSKLKFPLIIRSWNIGDKFQPLGMKNYKKISDFFIDNKISIIDKRKSYVILSDEEIVCIIGYRISDKFKITDETQEILEIK